MPPTAEARATADRLMFDTGNLKYLATQLPKGALERTVSGPGWTVRQVLAHLADAQQGYAEMLEWLQDGPRPEPSRFDPVTHNADIVAKHRETPLPQIISLFDSSIRRLVPAFVVIDESASQLGASPHGLPDVLRVWARHAAGHAMEMLDVLPELRDDPMLLNWLLYEDFSEEPEHLASQQRLMEEVQDSYADRVDQDGREEEDR